jgi:anaerobic selenocysteine-containing dehydrogenase
MKAVDPPGEARSDLDILLHYARRMDFRDKDGTPLVKWRDPESAFEHWKDCTKGRPCDYTGLSYAKLTGGSGIPWPCNEAHPDGAERLYTDSTFHTSFEDCELFGHDLLTGGAITGEEYRGRDPRGRAVIKPAEYVPATEQPDEDYPLWLTTGRVAHHFHTRTKTGRAKALQEAAPDVFVQISETDAARLGVSEGELVEVASRRGQIQARVRVGGILDGHVFVPFHYGTWDDASRPRAANELTLTGWDPVSKQPHVKFAAVRIRKP